MEFCIIHQCKLEVKPPRRHNDDRNITHRSVTGLSRYYDDLKTIRNETAFGVCHEDLPGV